MSTAYLELKEDYVKPTYSYSGRVIGFIMGEVNLFFMLFPFEDFFVTFGKWINLTSVTNMCNSLFAMASLGYFIVASGFNVKIRNAIFLIAYTAFIILSYTWAEGAMKADAKSAILRTAITVIQCLVIVKIFWEKGDEYVFTALKRFAIIVAIMGALSIALFPSESSWTIDDTGRKQGFFSSPNNLGQFLSFAFLFVNFYKRSEFSWPVVIFLNAIIIYQIFECDSKTSLTGGLICFVLYHFRFLIKPFLLFVIGAGLYLPIYTRQFAKGKEAEKIDFAERDMSFTGRSDVWDIMQGDLDATNRRMLGFGVGGYWGEKTFHPKARIHELTWEPHQGHNGYLDVQLNTGIFGAILFFLFLLEYFRNIFSKLTNRNIVMLFMSIIFCINNITETSFFRGKHFFFVILMLIFWYANMKDKEDVEEEEEEEQEPEFELQPQPVNVPQHKLGIV